MGMQPSHRVRMEPGTVEIDGRVLHYAISDNEVVSLRGVPPQIWAVNVHGYFAGGGMYWRESARLAGGLGWRVVNPSLPGFGGSEPLPWDDLSMTGFASVLAGLLDHLGAPGPVVLLGHSMGGCVVIQFAHDHPDRTLGLVYRDGAATASWKERQSILARVLSPLSPDLGAMVDLVSAVAVDVPIGRRFSDAVHRRNVPAGLLPERALPTPAVSGRGALGASLPGSGDAVAAPSA